jgi:hypothetical protein
MAKDIEQQLDAIFAQHKARVAQARNEAAGKTAAEDNFSQAATVCGLISPSADTRALVTASAVTRTSEPGQIAKLGGSTLNEIPLTVAAVAR